MSKRGEEQVSVFLTGNRREPISDRLLKIRLTPVFPRRESRVEGRAALSWKFKFYDLHQPLFALNIMSVDQINPGQAVYAQDEVSVYDVCLEVSR